MDFTKVQRMQDAGGLEVSKIVQAPGTIDIRAISVVPASHRVAEKSGMTVKEALDYYELKEEE